jgi:hypothetical protein
MVVFPDDMGCAIRTSGFGLTMLADKPGNAVGLSIGLGGAA